MKEIYIEIGQTLKNYRLKRKLTLEKISYKTKISIQNLNNIERFYETKIMELPSDYSKLFI